MSEVRIELSHTKTVMRQSQDETAIYTRHRAKTRHECVETEPRQRRVGLNMSRDETRVSRLHYWNIVFLTPSTDTQFQGEPFQRGAKYKGVGKLCDFRRKSLSISETARDKPMVAMER